MTSREQRGSDEHGNGGIVDGEPGAGTETDSTTPTSDDEKRRGA